MNRTFAMVVVGVVMLVAACRPGTPSQYIQPDDMEDILVDYFMARAMAQEEGTPPDVREYNFALYTEAMLSKHGITQADFDSSLVYYYTRADRFDAIMQRVSERLEEQAMAMGASESEVGKYISYTASGDTANIWNDRSAAILLTAPPYNRWEFELADDSTYRRGDAFLIMFNSDFMFQNGEKKGWVYIAAEYADTVVGRGLRFSSTGLTQLRLPEDTTRVVRAVKGYIYLDGGFDASPATRLLFLSNVQLIRFHTRPAEEPADAPEPDDAAQPDEPDSIVRPDEPADPVAASKGLRPDEILPETKTDSL